MPPSPSAPEPRPDPRPEPRPDPRPDQRPSPARESTRAAGQPDYRASDADRDRTLEALREACAEGRLTAEEYEDRAGRALSARTAGELLPLIADLPVAGTIGPMPAVQDNPVIAILSSDSRSGRWAVPPQLRAVAVMGSVKLDLTEAVPTARETHFTCVSVMGEITIVVPEGVDVRMDGTTILGDRSAKKLTTPPVPGAPVIHVHAFVLMGTVEVKPKKRSGALQRWLGRRIGPADQP